MSKTPFVYRPRTEEQVRRHLAIANWEDGIYQAYRKNTKMLCDYLRSPDLPLDKEKRYALESKMSRPISPAPPSPHATKEMLRFFLDNPRPPQPC